MQYQNPTHILRKNSTRFLGRRAKTSGEQAGGRAGNREGGYQIQEHDTAELKFNSIKGTHGTERVLSQKHLWMQSREQILEKKKKKFL